MTSPQPYAIGIDVGGTNIKTVAVALDGRLLFQSQQPTKEAQTDWPQKIRQVITEVESKQAHPAGYVGLAAPGLVAADKRSIAWMHGRMESLQNLDWTDYLQSSRVIPVINDAQAALLGEVWKGAAVGRRNVVMLTLGTGVGGSAIVDGRLLHGEIGRAGHLGHISLNPDAGLDIVGTPGSLEDAIGECTLPQRSAGRFTATLQLVKAHEDGDAAATEIWRRSLQALTAGIVSLINVLDPEVIIIGGGIADAGERLFVPLQERLDLWEWRPTGSHVRLAPALLSSWAGAYGAAYYALQVNQPIAGETPCI